MGKGGLGPPRSFQIMVCIKENVLMNLIFSLKFLKIELKID
jgi:hypothetical protein